MQMTLQNQNLNVKKWNYGCYSSDNYGANSIAIELGTRTVYYSYNTVVAFKGYNSKGEYFDCICENIWGTTTGKHLNWINSDKSQRLSYNEFQKQLQEFLQ